MKILYLILLPILLLGQVVDEKFESFRNWTDIQSDSIVYAWSEIGDSMDAGGGAVKEFAPSIRSSVYARETQRLVPYILNQAGTFNYVSSPFVKGNKVPMFLKADSGKITSKLNSVGVTPMDEPDSNKTFVIVHRNKRLLIDYAATYAWLYGWLRIATNYRALFVTSEYNTGTSSYERMTYLRLFDNTAYDVSSGMYSLDTTYVPSGWFTHVLIFDRNVDSLFTYVNGEKIGAEDLNRSQYFSPSPGTNYAFTMNGSLASIYPNETSNVDNFYSDHIMYKGNIQFTKQMVRSLELPTGWHCTGNFKPYRLATGPIDTLTSLRWNLAMTSSDVNNAMYKLITLPSAGDYTLSLDSWQDGSGSLLTRIGTDTSEFTITGDSTNYTYTFSSLSAGSDTLWFYGTALSDSVVVDNILLSYIQPDDGQDKGFKERQSRKIRLQRIPTRRN